MKSYDHSFHAYIQGIILIGFALLMLGLVLSGNIGYYIAPQMMPFVYFGMMTFFLLGVVQIFRSTAKKNNQEEHQCGDHCDHDHQIKGPVWVKVLVYSIFILPVLSGFILPDRMLNSDLAGNRGIQFGSGLDLAQAAPEGADSPDGGEAPLSRAEAYLEDPEGYMDDLLNKSNESTGEDDEHYQIEDFYDQEWFDDFYLEFADELEQEEIITVTEANYLDVMTVLDLYLDRFVGKELEIIGFVYREADFEDHEIVAARFSMTCCTADAGVYGTLIESEEATEFENDMWIYARGVIKKGQYHDYQIPIITDSYLVEVEEPDSPYVYPSFNW
ncbi:putative membrane protein [Evansella caseinilytica]|uniref:Putative membrane protein n=1 Tax=Evansella caseinilytica TaxID=1503961 RepID=A0A1H3L5N3_9BACI|nr:TIGR03943 family protein [Evansella caseinilytica]SDY59244.1 putative membrane protein [Evansella caseinilytica]